MTARPKRQLPNVDDPLSEATPQRRLWAAYLRAGYTRASFARLLGVVYHTLDAWDTGVAMPDLPRFAAAAVHVGYTVDELLWGHGGMQSHAGSGESALSVEGVRRLLDQLQATAEQRQALGEHRESARGIYASFTATYVRTFISAYAAAREKLPHAEVKLHAVIEAENAQAIVAARLRGAQPISTERLKTLPERVRQRLAPAKKKRAAKSRSKRTD